jgi:hypothetical protein
LRPSRDFDVAGRLAHLVGQPGGSRLPDSTIEIVVTQALASSRIGAAMQATKNSDAPS